MAPAPSSPSVLRRAWLRWKSLQLPWRKRFLVGHDLNGNTYWEFRDQLATDANRMRRIVQQQRGHASDVQVSPQWHQWLRHVRHDPPSHAEQVGDVIRLRELKERARLADLRWAAKGRIAGGEGENVRREQARASDNGVEGRDTRTKGNETQKNPDDTTTKQDKDDPWKQARRNPGEEWQPESWAPAREKRR